MDMNRLRFCIRLAAVCAPVLCFAGTHSKVDINFGKVPLSFEPNRGQSEARVDYVSRGQGYALLLTRNEAVLRLRTGSLLRMRLLGSSSQSLASGVEPLPGKANYFLGNDPSKWRTDIPTYQKVKYTGVYPGVDLVYYGNQGRLEHDFIMAPGADPSEIGLSFEGAKPRIDGQGDLCLTMAEGALRLERPVVYQIAEGRKRIVDGRYVLAGNIVRFEIGAYDRSRELVIDPLLVYTSYLGGNTYDYGTGIAVDSTGAAYVTGWTSSADFPTVNPIGSLGQATSIAFVSKFNSSGTALVYSTYLGGTAVSDQVFYNPDITVDSQFNAYVSGTTDADDFPVTPGAFQTICGPSEVNNQVVPGCNPYTNGFLTKINPAGNGLAYSTFLGGGGGGSTIINAVAVDAAGEAYVTGYTGDVCSGANEYPVDCFPTTSGALQSGYQIGAGYGNPFAFVTKFDAAGASLLYSTLYGSQSVNSGNCTLACNQNTTEGTAIAVDSKGDAYVTGWTMDANIPITPAAFQTTAAPIEGNNDPANYYLILGERGFVAKFDPTRSGAASLIYATFLGGTVSGDDDRGTGIAVDSKFNAYITGQAGSPDFPTTSHAFQKRCYSAGGATGECATGFITKLNPAGSAAIYSTMLGDANTSESAVTMSRIQVNSSGNAFVAGWSGAFPLQNPIQSSPGGAFVTEMNPSGSALLFSSYFGGAGACCAIPQSLALDNQGNIYVTGYSGGDLSVTPGAFQQNYGGGQSDAFVAKIAPVATDVQVTNSAPASVVTGKDLTYTVTAGNNGPDPASKVVVTDNIPTGATFVSVTTSAGSCKSPSPGGTGRVTCTIGDLAVSATVTVTLKVKVNAAAGMQVSDTARISAAGFDPDTANNSSTVKTKVTN